MRDALTGLLEKADLALASCEGIVHPENLADLGAAVGAVRTRLSYPEDLAVVALAGGTGSGKSSLFNALAGADLVDVGGVRPTTTEPAAVIPRGLGDSLSGYLKRIGVIEMHEADVGGFCVIDLPDTDSVELSHRDMVEEILPMVDLVMWVLDPEKYKDARLHGDFIKPLADYSAQFVFVLNQADRISGEIEALVADLTGALIADGVGEPVVVATAASPPAGPPFGLEELVEVLVERSRSSLLHNKLLTDLVRAADHLVEEAGRPVNFDERVDDVVVGSAELVARGDTVMAVEQLTGFLDGVAADIGGPLASEVRRFGSDVRPHLARIAEDKSPVPVRRRWWQRRQDPESRDQDEIARAIREAVVRPVRGLLAKRALALASIAELAVEATSLRRRAGS